MLFSNRKTCFRVETEALIFAVNCREYLKYRGFYRFTPERYKKISDRKIRIYPDIVFSIRRFEKNRKTTQNKEK